MSMSEQFPAPFVSGQCAGCGVLLDDAGIVMAEPDPWVRLACGPWEQESCGERTLPLSYWPLAPKEVRIAWTAALASLTSIVSSGS